MRWHTHFHPVVLNHLAQLGGYDDDLASRRTGRQRFAAYLAKLKHRRSWKTGGSPNAHSGTSPTTNLFPEWMDDKFRPGWTPLPRSLDECVELLFQKAPDLMHSHCAQAYGIVPHGLHASHVPFQYDPNLLYGPMQGGQALSVAYPPASSQSPVLCSPITPNPFIKPYASTPAGTLANAPCMTIPSEVKMDPLPSPQPSTPEEVCSPPTVQAEPADLLDTSSLSPFGESDMPNDDLLFNSLWDDTDPTKECPPSTPTPTFDESDCANKVIPAAPWWATQEPSKGDASAPTPCPVSQAEDIWSDPSTGQFFADIFGETPTATATSPTTREDPEETELASPSPAMGDSDLEDFMTPPTVGSPKMGKEGVGVEAVEAVVVSPSVSSCQCQVKGEPCSTDDDCPLCADYATELAQLKQQITAQQDSIRRQERAIAQLQQMLREQMRATQTQATQAMSPHLMGGPHPHHVGMLGMGYGFSRKRLPEHDLPPRTHAQPRLSAPPSAPLNYMPMQDGMRWDTYLPTAPPTCTSYAPLYTA
eukprot:gnl/Trimastix_PCT/3608.p1 GENE.gnl/Trimastix_PCT/3608~~gnl/Trimastix_PCT/3608.p1  ORF type:complete len:533 (+),score=82.87 gnl/Trimastix_PCT/3608:189-1787(+)